MKRWKELIRDNVFGLRGHRDHLPTSLAHMLYCIVAEEQYNLAYFFVKRIESARATPNANLPYGMVMRPLALKQTRKPQSDHGMPKARHSVSSSSANHYGSSSHHGDDDEDDDASRASTLSPTTYLNFLSLLNYQKYDIPICNISQFQDFAAALVVLITRVSQSRQYGKSEPIPPVLAGSWERIPNPNHLITPRPENVQTKNDKVIQSMSATVVRLDNLHWKLS
ncbi:hypothetical protein Tco_1295465 [Tanacetum coccineum]